MRVLVTTPAGLGHIHPMVPLARALAGRGHEVRWALPELAAAHVAQYSLEVIPVAGREPITPQEVLRRYPELAELSPRDRPEAVFGKLFGALATPPMLKGLERVARDWRPHLVVADAAEFAGHIVAAMLGIPSVTKGFGATSTRPRCRSRPARTCRVASSCVRSPTTALLPMELRLRFRRPDRMLRWCT
jgi:UDP:flavonoid glycosyltransferase YjiC (YdhE family)